MTTISAEVVLASRNVEDPDPRRKLVTLLLRYPRCIHAELLTHRAFSKNSASSRAIPVKRLIASVEADPYVPLYWGQNQRGMQAERECSERVLFTDSSGTYDFSREQAWLAARDNAVWMARAYDAAGYHKQVVNRLLEPFAHITVVLSATEWGNFFALRRHGAAEPHFQLLARRIGEAIEAAPVQELAPGQWHLPFVSEDEGVEFSELAGPVQGLGMAKVLSVARCASTSYKTVEGFDMDYRKAREIYDGLVASDPVHASPSEHVAMADYAYDDGYGNRRWRRPQDHRNFVGFRQHRAEIYRDTQ